MYRVCAPAASNLLVRLGIAGYVQPMDNSSQTDPLPGLMVTEPEDGLRLKTFLARRLEPPPPSSVLHRWIRTGQVRVNKSRSEPFAVLRKGDVVRIPPFALPKRTSDQDRLSAKIVPLPEGFILADEPDYLVLAKPAGLAVQPGTNLSGSVSQMLKAAYANRHYPPAPAHRLDRHVSGLLLAGKTRAAQQELSSWFAEPGTIRKIYLAWVVGEWPFEKPVRLEDWLVKEQGSSGKEVTGIVPPGTPGAVHAICEAECIERRSLSGRSPLHSDTASLIKISLLTGRTHQIRVQLAGKGTPIIGDGRHGGPDYPRLLLHACELSLPNGKSYGLLADWPSPFAVSG